MTTPTGPNPAPAFKSNTDGLDGDAILKAANDIMQLRTHEQYRLHKIAKYMRGNCDPPYTPRGASTEYRWLLKRSKDNFLPLICQAIAQNLHVDGFRPSFADADTGDDTMLDTMGDPGWAAWRANRMVSRQHGIHRSVIKYGCAYAQVLPGRIAVIDQNDAVVDTSMPVITPFSPRRMTALYADDISDEWPIIAVSEYLINDRTAPGKARRVVTVLDDTNRYILVGGVGTSPSKLAWPNENDPILGGRPIVSQHGMGLCPVVRFTYEADLDSDTDCVGEIEPLMSLQDQVNFHTFNELLAEQFAAFKQRWVSGMVPVDETGREGSPFKPGVDRLWVAEDADTKFGEFSETNIGAIIQAREATIRHMSTLSQVPSYNLLGDLVNLSADALSAANGGMDRKAELLRGILTDSWRNVFRLCSKAQQDQDGWMDLFGTVVWRDTSTRSFAATIDGLTKAAQMLGVPAEQLWRRIPGATAEDVAMWQKVASQKDAMAAIDKVVEAALTGGAMAGGTPSPDQPNQIGAVGAMAPGANIAAAPPDQVGGSAAGPTPPGTPGNPQKDADANGNPPKAPSGTTMVHVPAHTRAMPTGR
jgi:hypothetical protein